MKIGIVVDSHGKPLAPAKNFFENEEVDAILVNGDFQDYNNNLESILELGGDIPTYVIPGSHENKAGYNEIMRRTEEEFDNIINAKKKGIVKLNDDIALVPYGGATWLPRGTYGFANNPLIDISEIYANIESCKPKPKTVVLQMHEPPRGYGDIAQFVQLSNGSRAPLSNFKHHPQYAQIKMAAQKAHVGNDQLALLVEELLQDYNIAATFGHIHENYLLGPSAQEIPSGKEVLEGKKVEKLAVNAGPYMEGFVTLIKTDDNNQISYQREKLF